MKIVRILSIFFAVLIIYACSHPIEIVGEGDVWSSGGRTCTLEDYHDGLNNCSKNMVTEAYQETYYAEPRAGWEFHGWGNYCQGATDNTCSFDVSEEAVHLFLGMTLPPLQAIFTPIGNIDSVFVDGKEWLQTDLFRGSRWREIEAVCPGGICVEGGKLNGINMTGWTWASTDDVNALFNFYIGSEQLGPGPDSFSDMDEDFTEVMGWRFFYVEEEPSLQVGAWRPNAPWTDSEVISVGFTFSASTPDNFTESAGISFNYSAPGTTVWTGHEDTEGCAHVGVCLAEAIMVGAWFYRTP